jgi:hypothetical protein
MSIWNKILLGCIALTALVLFVLSARALQAHRVWRESYNQHKEAIAAAEQKAKDIVNGNSEAGQMGLRTGKLELYKLLIGRGRVWDNVIPTNVEKGPDPGTDPPQERVLITLQTEEPDAIEAKAVLYAFQYQPAAAGEESKLPTERGSYLGQFTVEQVGGNQVIVRPSVRLSDREFARVEASRQAQIPWRLYELMPTDDHDVLLDLAQEEKEFLFPNKTTFGDTAEDEKYSTINDYLYDGQIITKQEAETMDLNGKVVMVDEAGSPVRNEEGLYTAVEDGKGMFIRTLRDYEILFDEEHRIRSMIVDRIRAAQRDLQFLKESLDDSRLQRQARQNEIRDLQQELAKVTRQRDTVLQHEARLDGAIASMERAIADLVARNEAAVAQVAQIQTEAAQVINARSAGVVQASTRQPTGP